ncbi:hypothetical protein BX600DRAFT_508454 [Xylariales sp. PMI_506]|nr:hypothetical protein BX600DRAFT_508454 [Xylariales sp. PMI_506]
MNVTVPAEGLNSWQDASPHLEENNEFFFGPPTASSGGFSSLEDEPYLFEFSNPSAVDVYPSFSEAGGLLNTVNYYQPTDYIHHDIRQFSDYRLQPQEHLTQPGRHRKARRASNHSHESPIEALSHQAAQGGPRRGTSSLPYYSKASSEVSARSFKSDLRNRREAKLRRASTASFPSSAPSPVSEDEGEDGGSGGHSTSAATRRPNGTPRLHGRNREKNRLAASKCREKSKKYIDELQERERELAAQQQSLAACAAGLREEVLALKHEIFRHGDCDCEFIQKYLLSAARAIQSPRA